jgi:DNA-3-methyladenine glycosylase
MLEHDRLPRNFYNRSTTEVARQLLGTRLVRIEGRKRVAGLIIEAEAYRGEEDQGCHARAGRTPRTQTMFGPPGHAYVYFTYGMHWMLNFVTEEEGFPQKHWTDGPGKICQALAIDGEFNGADLCRADAHLFVEYGDPIPDQSVTIGPRVGLNNVPEPWKSIPWRFLVSDGYFSMESR